VQIISALFLYPFLPLEQLPFSQEISFMCSSTVTSYPAVVCSGCCSIISSRVCSSTVL